MSKSWTNDSVSIRVLDKGNAPQLNKQVLWPSSDNETFFAFGGEESYLDNPWYPPDILLWQFTADGEGGGKWDVFNANSDSIFFNLTRPTDGLGGVVDDTGFIVGGYTNSHSSIATDYQMDNIEIPNIASFNITSGEWNNDTAPAYLERQNGTYGIIHPVPTFGPAGLLAITGTTFTDGRVDRLSNITLYEPSGKTWYTQRASGDIPNGRDHPCTVGVRGDNGTYEMYVDKPFTFLHSYTTQTLTTPTASCTEATPTPTSPATWQAPNSPNSPPTTQSTSSPSPPSPGSELPTPPPNPATNTPAKSSAAKCSPSAATPPPTTT